MFSLGYCKTHTDGTNANVGHFFANYEAHYKAQGLSQYVAHISSWIF